MALRPLLDRQGAELGRILETSSRWVLSALDDARRALRDLLAVPRPLRPLLALVDTWIVDLRQRLSRELSASEQAAHEAVGRHLIAIVRRAEGWHDPDGRLQRALLAELAQTRALALHQHTATRFSAQVGEVVQRRIVGGTKPEIVTGPAGPVAQSKPRADLMARMATATAYNDGYLEALKALEAVDPRPGDPLMKRIEEWIDARNHPFSRVADGLTVPLSEPFRVSVADVSAMAATLKTRGGGVLWPIEDGAYTGQSLPAHFHDRGRLTAWRASWSP